jgi:hypothetical protein
VATLIAIGGLVLLAGLGWWAFSRSRKRVGKLETLQESEVRREQMDEILSEPVPLGAALRARMRARRMRAERRMRERLDE